MIVGPQVAFVDDFESHIKPLEKAFEELHTGTIFFDAAPSRAKHPTMPIETIKILFLDLYYSQKLDITLCAQWVQEIVPPNTKYTLVIWSKDTDEVYELQKILDEISLSPAYTEIWQKTDYSIAEFNFKERMSTLIETISTRSQIQQEVIYGEIVELEDDGVLINCLLNKDNPTFQVRRFDIDLLKNIEDLDVGVIVRISIYTKPGARLIDIFKEKNDKKYLFQQQDFFKGLEGNSFFIEG